MFVNQAHEWTKCHKNLIEFIKNWIENLLSGLLRSSYQMNCHLLNAIVVTCYKSYLTIFSATANPYTFHKYLILSSANENAINWSRLKGTLKLLVSSTFSVL